MKINRIGASFKKVITQESHLKTSKTSEKNPQNKMVEKTYIFLSSFHKVAVGCFLGSWLFRFWGLAFFAWFSCWCLLLIGIFLAGWFLLLGGCLFDDWLNGWSLILRTLLLWARFFLGSWLGDWFLGSCGLKSYNWHLDVCFQVKYSRK